MSKLRWIPAALVTALSFSLAHGYGILGFTTILWSGLVLTVLLVVFGPSVPSLVSSPQDLETFRREGREFLLDALGDGHSAFFSST